jgi:hypothetical protein
VAHRAREDELVFNEVFGPEHRKPYERLFAPVLWVKQLEELNRSRPFFSAGAD